MRHVRAALAAAALHRVAEDVDQKLGIFFLPVKAVRQHAHELLLFRVQQHRVHDAATDDIRHERAAHIVHRAELEGLVDIDAARLPLFQLLPAKQQEKPGKFPLNVPWFCAKFTLSIKCFLKTRINSFCLALAFPVPIFLSARPAAAFLQKSAP